MQVIIDRVKKVYEGFVTLLTMGVTYKSQTGEVAQQQLLAIDRQEVVAILPYDPQRDEVVLIDELRPVLALKQANTWVTGIPAGLISDAESPEEAARRELLEETGLRALQLKLIQSYWVSPGVSTERIHLYLAQVDLADYEGGAAGLVSEMEFITCYKMSREQLMHEKMQDINNALALLALWWLQLHHAQIQNQPQRGG